MQSTCMKLESMTQDLCVYLLFGGHSTTNTFQTKNGQLIQLI